VLKSLSAIAFASTIALLLVSIKTVQPAADPVPDRILLTWASDPATSQAVTWRTSTAVGAAQGQIAVATPDPKFGQKATRVDAKTQEVDVGGGRTAFYHSVNFRGLKPNTLYGYRVGDGRTWSEWSHFRTAASGPAPFTFIYVGDAQNDIKSLWSRAIRSAFQEASKARFILHAGDLIDNANNDAQWGEWFYAAGWINSTIPSIATPGNHEYAREEGSTQRRLSRLWRPQFEYPLNGPQGLEETCYYIDFQGVRIISLNSNERVKEQAPWLEKVLRDNPMRWTVVTFHHPVFSLAGERDNTDVRDNWRPLFDKYKVDLVLQGHDHTYGRTRNLMSGMNARDGEAGPVYVVSISGPKMYTINPKNLKPMKRVGEDTQLYQIVTVNDAKLFYKAFTVTGELYDAFELRKGSDGRNQMIDQMPATPDRRRG
jgi:3',5'-cyclic AMP phosphodiesterase CpdA